MPYILMTGTFVIRYADIPRQGPEPDGDTVKFQPDNPGLVEALPRISGTPPRINPRGVSVRLEAIDALETHFENLHQELNGAHAARDFLLAALGFTNVRYFRDLPNKVESVDRDVEPGYVLSNGVDANGRVIGFVYGGVPPVADGASVFLDEAGVDASVNANLLARGLVYPALYGTLPASLREHLRTVTKAARTANTGMWISASGDPSRPATVTDLDSLRHLTIWPKIFRRLVPYLAAGNSALDAFDTWLRADPVNRDDRLLLFDPTELGNMHDVIDAAGSQIQLTRWPEDFVIEPDPSAGGVPTTPHVYIPGDVVIVAALPNPVGVDAGSETVFLANVTAAEIDLQGWKVLDGDGRQLNLTESIPGGAIAQIRLTTGVALDNLGDSVTLMVRREQSSTGWLIRSQVKPGRTIVFGRG